MDRLEQVDESRVTDLKTRKAVAQTSVAENPATGRLPDGPARLGQ